MTSGLERTIDAAGAEIAWHALQASTLPEERTLAVDLIVDGLLERIRDASAGARATALQRWLDATYEVHSELPCLGPVLIATWRQVLQTGREQGRLKDSAALVAIGEIVEDAVRKPRRSHAAPAEPLDAIDAVISDLIARLFEKDVITGEHSRAVSSWCSRLARNLGLSPVETALVRRGGLLHDIGKVGTPEEILNAPRKLTADEWEIMQRHTVDGAHIVADIPILDEFLPAIRNHHERLDGEGYPDRLRAEQIPLSARIVSVADCFNAMIGRRPYRPPMAPSRGLEELERIAGSHLDPEIVAAMIQVVSGQRADKK
jgi:putative nucleotidyltransferase with HDIG domain